jgi:anti-anti-sigma factor
MAESVARLETSADGMQLFGEIDFASVMLLEQRGRKWLLESAPADCRLDLAGVSRCNSAIAALLLGWKRVALAAGKHLRIENPPAALRGIMELAGLEDVLTG